MLEVLVHRSLLGSHSFVFLAAFFALFTCVFAGQTFTNGLAIIDSPSLNNPGHAGSDINIAVDVSGNGQLPPAATLPGSGLATSYESLEIYLVSSQTNINITVSAGPALLTGESGSTVKHLNWPIPSCIPAGNYNLSFYESSHFNGQGVFAITPIPVPISNPSPSGECPGLNTLQTQPQASAPLRQSPFSSGSSLSITTARPSGMVTVIGSGSPDQTLTLTLSDGVLNLPTITVTATAQPTPTTVVVIATVTETDHGSVITYVQTSTMTTVIPGPTGAQADSSAGFIPVNAGSRITYIDPSFLFFCAWTLFCVLM